jgi:hypothetical protein
MATHRVFVMTLVLSILGCSFEPPEAEWIPSGTAVTNEFSFISDEDVHRVQTLLFASVDPRYVVDHAGKFADIGVDGLMICNLMPTWTGDIWRNHPTFAEDGQQDRIVGDGNPLFEICKQMNRRCREVGINYNSVLVAFSEPFPDWFDDDGWDSMQEGFRQCAIFARDAGFAGISLDIEYISPTYQLEHESYQAPDYPRDRLREKVRQRGRDLVAAMVSEFPEMILWQLPEGSHYYGPLAIDLTIGFVNAMAEVDAPGGYHLNIEGTYTVTHSLAIMKRMYEVEQAMRENLESMVGPKALDYWQRRGTISPGLWPLGYYRAIFDPVTGKRLGFSGKSETYGDSVVGSYADKSENYSVDDFRRQYASARMASRAFSWIYCHGSVLWELSVEELARYEGNWVDSLPLVENLEEYQQVLREKSIIDDPAISQIATTVREGRAPPGFKGYAPAWWHIGPFPYPGGTFDIAYPPEEVISPTMPGIDLSSTYESYPGYEMSTDTLRWRMTGVDSTGYVDLKDLVSRQDSVLSYSVAWLDMTEPRRVHIRFGCNDDGAVWLNGERIFTHIGPRGAMADNDVFYANLPAGRTQILVKIGDHGGAGYGFYLRVTDEMGAKVSGLRWVKPRS